MDIKFEVKQHVPREAQNDFAPLVTAGIEQGADALIEFIVPEGVAPGYAKVKVQQAARAADRSARFTRDEDTKAGHVLAFYLGKRVERKGKNSDKVEEVEAADTPK